MKVLLIGSGGREHVLAWKISQSPKLAQLFIAPGNAGTNDLGQNINIAVNDFITIGNFCLEQNIDMVVVGPEEPLVNGIKDHFLSTSQLASIPVIGPAKYGAQLEGSKKFAKEFMQRHNVPTAAYFTVTPENLDDGIEFLRKKIDPPYVLKADGLAAGKGVLILDDINEAIDELELMFNGKFGDAGKTVVIEEHLSGIELSVFVLTDGQSYITLPEAKDYKRIGEGDTGLNTGGMGAITPVPFADETFLKKVEDRIIRPTVEGIKSEEIDYTGFIFIGLMNVHGDPYVIEYNVRMGDPEAEVVLPRVKNDILDIFEAIANKQLSGKQLEIDDRSVVTLVLVSGGYPENYEIGKVIIGLENKTESIVFHAGTKVENNQIVTNGGRVLAITSFGKDMNDALAKSYNVAEDISFEGKYFRKDIGFDL